MCTFILLLYTWHLLFGNAMRAIKKNKTQWLNDIRVEHVCFYPTLNKWLFSLWNSKYWVFQSKYRYKGGSVLNGTQCNYLDFIAMTSDQVCLLYLFRHPFKGMLPVSKLIFRVTNIKGFQSVMSVWNDFNGKSPAGYNHISRLLNFSVDLTWSIENWE